MAVDSDRGVPLAELGELGDPLPPFDRTYLLVSVPAMGVDVYDVPVTTRAMPLLVSLTGEIGHADPTFTEPVPGTWVLGPTIVRGCTYSRVAITTTTAGEPVVVNRPPVVVDRHAIQHRIEHTGDGLPTVGTPGVNAYDGPCS